MKFSVLQQPVGLLKLILDLLYTSNIQEGELCWHDVNRPKRYKYGCALRMDQKAAKGSVVMETRRAKKWKTMNDEKVADQKAAKRERWRILVPSLQDMSYLTLEDHDQNDSLSVCVFVCVFVHIYVCVYVCVCMYVHMYIVCVCVCECVCVCSFTRKSFFSVSLMYLWASWPAMKNILGLYGIKCYWSEYANSLGKREGRKRDVYTANMLLFGTGCGGNLIGSSGSFSSPGYPNSYSHGRTCEWLITVNTSYAVQLTITDFDMENSRDCTYDALEVTFQFMLVFFVCLCSCFGKY